MHGPAERGDPHPAQAPDAPSQERAVDTNVAARARDQAARVRESLVRCPGVDDQRAA
jgi:hypothetical protein